MYYCIEDKSTYTGEFREELANEVNDHCTISYIRIYSFDIFQIQRISIDKNKILMAFFFLCSLE